MSQQSKLLIKAISTPLSSIFGSGFLVIVPILAGAVGKYSGIVMAGVCLIAYAVGYVIRFNIKNAEPILAGNPGKATVGFERTSDIALVLAYIISVCLYLHILASFVLGSFHIDTELNENWMTTGIIVLILIIGLTKGLEILGSLEHVGLIITLIIIALLIFGYGYYDFMQWKSIAGIQLFKASDHSIWEIITIVAGTLIVVQGFETPRYLGNDFSVDIRVKASRNSQLIATGVYLIFIFVALPVVHVLNGQFDDNSLIKITTVAAGALLIPLVIAAALSQFAAAVADTITAAGNMGEISNNKITSKLGTLIVGVGAIALTWVADTLEILAIASRAFAFYYFLQCLVAISISKSIIQKVFFAVISLVLLFITIFAVPAG